jgi:hypothetical protein
MDDILGAVRSVLVTTPTHWQALAASLPDEALRRDPAPGEWSALACLGHLTDGERWVFPARVEAFRAGRDFAAFDPDAQGTPLDQLPSVAELAAEFARLRAESLALLATLTEADLGRTARHSELGTVTLGQLLHEWAAHDLMHTMQAESALMQPFIAGLGPWYEYFQHHDATATAVRPT